MGWAVGYDEKWKRWVGYGVPAYCDHPDCNEVIDRGLAYVCAGEEPYGGDGCGLYFCENHKGHYKEAPSEAEADDPEPLISNCCERCRDGKEPFNPKPDHPDWIQHQATDPSWEEWRQEQSSDRRERERGA